MHAAVLVAAAIAVIGAIGVLIWLPARARTHPDDVAAEALDAARAVADDDLTRIVTRAGGRS
jgi:hypothetical protein